MTATRPWQAGPNEKACKDCAKFKAGMWPPLGRCSEWNMTCRGDERACQWIQEKTKEEDCDGTQRGD